MAANSLVVKDTPKLCQLTDRFGNTFYYGNAGDFWHPSYPIGSQTDFRTHACQIRELDIRDDDIIISSYPKTGSHWHCEIVTMLVTKSTEYQPEDKMVTPLDFFPIDVTRSRPSPRILWTHYPFRHLPKQIWRKKVKVVYPIRNPKDVLVSYYNVLHSNTDHLGYPGTFEEFVQTSLETGFYYGDIFDYLMEFQDGFDANPEVEVFVSQYEKMLEDPVGVIEKLNVYLGTGCSKELCQGIAAACAFKKLKAFKDSTRPDNVKALFKNPDSASFFRKGIKDDWKNWFTPELLELYEEEYKKRMSNYKIQFS